MPLITGAIAAAAAVTPAAIGSAIAATGISIGMAVLRQKVQQS